jgi:curved DNA-binding protein CbpA
MRYDLAFFLCCCKSFLHSSTRNSTDYYDLLGIDKDATQDEVKRAYKRQSLQMHPDKLAQRGMTVTEQDQARFQRMKEAYEVSFFFSLLSSTLIH